MKLTYRLVLYVSFLIFSFSLILVNPSRVSAQSSTPLKPNPVAEAWVLKQVKAGNIADLEKRFPNNEEERVLSAAFLESLLLTPSENITRQGIRIKNAIFIDPLDFRYIKVDHEVKLENCRFDGDVNISESHFTHDLSFIGSTFTSSVNLSRIQIDKTLFIGKANFENSTDFSYANLAENLRVIDAQFNNKKQKANFIHMRADGDVILQGANFAGPVDFRYVEVGNNFEANGAQFNYDGTLSNEYGERVVNNFGSMKVGYSIHLNSIRLNGIVKRVVFAGPVDFRYVEVSNNFEANDAIFEGPVNFANVDVGNNFDADDAQFNNIEQTAYFGQMKVAYKVLLNRAIFEGPVNFDDLDVGNIFEAQNAQFKSTEKTASFRHMKVGAAVLLNGVMTIFEGPVDFRYTEVETNFEANGAHFNYDGALLDDNNERIVNNFGSMKVGNFVLINQAVFSGPVDFRYTEVETNFEANGAHFNYDGALLDDNNERIVNNFGSMKVGNRFIVNGARFNNTKGTSYFGNMKVGALLLNGARFAGPTDFRYTEVNNNFEANNAKFRGIAPAVNLNHIKVGDTISLKGTLFVGQVLLSNLQCYILDMESVTWPLESVTWPSEPVKMEGMTYQSIVYQSIVAKKHDIDPWQELISLVDQSPFNAQTYKTLETFFENQGYPEWADKVYIAYKIREGKEILNWRLIQLNWRSKDWWLHEFLGLLFQLGWNKFLYVFIGYGRSPVFAFFWGLGVVFVGYIVFRKEDEMVELSKKDTPRGKKSDPNENARPYYPFWYSLDLFIAPVDLGVASRWEPKLKGKWVYSKVQMLLGWILIPIALLTLAGVIK